MSWDSLAWIEEELERLRGEHLLRRPSLRGSRQGPRIVTDGQELVNFGSNDYLGLAGDPRLAEAAAQALAQFGWGAGASPLITGRSAVQAELERHLAAWEQTEAALVFPTGFAANAGTVSALVGPGDLVFSDAKNHASLIDGCRISRARIVVYPHGDMGALAELLRQAPESGRRLIVTDSLFSMDGDYAPLPDLVELSRRHRAMLMVDEAHATGVLGEHGRGLCERMGVEADVPVRVGTFSKALGSVGGFTVGSRRLIDWLYNRGRSFVFSTALPASCHAASCRALQLVRAEPQARRELLDKAAACRQSLREQGWQVGPGDSQIIPIVLSDPERTMGAALALREAGMLVPGIRPPTVPRGESLLRISICRGHSAAQLERLLTTLADLRKTLA
jgi:8-amino-7-oxononanoate synthase